MTTLIVIKHCAVLHTPSDSAKINIVSVDTDMLDCI